MAHKFIRVRRVDDHETTTEIAEQSLPVWAGIWEPVPEAEAGTPERSPAASRPPETSGDSTDDASKPARKSRSSAASTDKE